MRAQYQGTWTSKMNRKVVTGILITISLATSAWAGLTLINHAERLSGVETQVRSINDWMERIDSKLDRLLER